MSYMDIDNLYKAQEILMFKECYALEKIHGTSAHIKWNGTTHFASGGEKHSRFVGLFDEAKLIRQFVFVGQPDVIIYGEAYGGKQQGMSHTYGKELKFVVFDIKICGLWLAVPQAEQLVREFGLEFVHYDKVSTDIDVLTKLRDADSVQAVRNGMGEGHSREGIVLRPLFEVRKNNDERVIAKFKGEKFSETKTVREISPEQLKVLEEANAVADEWVTEMRMTHVLDAFADKMEIQETGNVFKAMIEDVVKEGEGEFVDNREVRKAIGKKAAQMFKSRLESLIS